MWICVKLRCKNFISLIFLLRLWSLGNVTYPALTVRTRIPVLTFNAEETPPAHVGGGFREPITIIAGDMTTWDAHAQPLPTMDGLTFVDIEDLSAELLHSTGAEIIMSSLFVRNFDAIEIARRLQEIGFGGRYRVVMESLPNASLVESEVAASAPDLDFAIVSLSDGMAP